jgi:hypothetical protein
MSLEHAGYSEEASGRYAILLFFGGCFIVAIIDMVSMGCALFAA